MRRVGTEHAQSMRADLGRKQAADDSVYTRVMRLPLCILVAATCCASCTVRPLVDAPKQIASSSVAFSSATSSAAASEPVSTSSSESVPPERVLLAAPFMPQAPTANWDDVHQEACEEMSLILAVLAKRGQMDLTPTQAEAELQRLLEFQDRNGYAWDVSMTELQQIAKDFYGLESRVVAVHAAEDLERELAAGRFVIVPLAGRLVGNPYYSGEGPWYHAVLLIGYTPTAFITHDVGTKRGREYPYEKQRFLNAIHDWTGVKEDIVRGERQVLVIE